MTIHHPHLFEISAWPWLERLGRAEGRVVTLGTVPAREWDRIAEWGFDYVFLMGVWCRSAIGREIARSDPGLRAEYDRTLPGWTRDDVAGSPYCVRAYEPDDRVGGWRGLDAARQELRTRGVRLILDFVPNHTAFDHAWIAKHPDRYILGTAEDYRRAPAEFRSVETSRGTTFVACARDPYFPPWTDVAQLNYFNPDTRTAMQATLRAIAAHCDGVRCDMAMLVLNDVFERTWRRLLHEDWPAPSNDFWADATRAVPDLLYLAEVYWNLEARVLDEGFTFAYDKRLLDALHGSDAASRVQDVLSAASPDPARLARFLENHDEPRSAATVRRCLPAAVALVATGPGLRFFYDGQLDGRRVRTPVQLGRWMEEEPDLAIRTLYERTLRFARQPLLREGEWKLLHVTPAGDHSFNDMVAWRWRSPGALAVVVANFGRSAAQAHVRLAGDLLDGDSLEFTDALSGASYPWTCESLLDSGLYVRLEGGSAHLFNVNVGRAGSSSAPGVV